MVMEVSAMFVATTTLRWPAGVGSNTSCCCCGDSEEYSGSTVSCVASFGKSAAASCRAAQVSVISFSPVRKRRMSPGPSLALI